MVRYADDDHDAGGDEDTGGEYRGGRDDELDAEQTQDDEHDRDEYRAAQGPQGRDDLHNQQRRAVDRRSDCRKDDDYVENFKRYGQRRVRLPQLAEGVVIVVKPAQSGKLHYNVDNIGKYAHGYKRKYYGGPAVVYEVAQDLVAGRETRADVCAKPNRGN